LFSIIIPTFNSAETLDICLESIANQTFCDFEVLIIDGLSKDNTTEIAEKYRSKLRTLTIMSEPDQGIYDAMNKGIDLAKGVWLYFLGCDDNLTDNKVLENVSEEILKGGYDLIYGKVIGKSSLIVYDYDSVYKVLTTGIHHQSVFYKKSLFNKLGKYDLKFAVAADYHFTLKVFTENTFIKKYISLDIANYGEEGFSSKEYDYKFFSYHYKFLKNRKIKLDNFVSSKLINNSIYCCLQQARKKKDILFSWSNLIFYIYNCNEISIIQKIKHFYNMIIWTTKL